MMKIIINNKQLLKIKFFIGLINSFSLTLDIYNYYYNKLNKNKNLISSLEKNISTKFLKLSAKKIIEDIYLSKQKTYLFLWLLGKNNIPINKKSLSENCYSINKRIYFIDISNINVKKRLKSIKSFILKDKKYALFFVIGPIKSALKKYVSKGQGKQKKEFLERQIVFYIKIFGKDFIIELIKKHQNKIKMENLKDCENIGCILIKSNEIVPVTKGIIIDIYYCFFHHLNGGL